jgi:hypothetical protein
MSRAVMAGLLFFMTPAFAQTSAAPAKGTKSQEAADLVKAKTADIVTVEDKKKCPEVTDADGIVVCAEIDNGEDQLIFGDQRIPESSGAQNQANAAACIPGTGCRVPPSGGVTIGFGKRRPPHIPYEEFLKGLPEPDAEEREGVVYTDFDPSTLPPPALVDEEEEVAEGESKLDESPE